MNRAAAAALMGSGAGATYVASGGQDSGVITLSFAGMSAGQLLAICVVGSNTATLSVSGGGWTTLSPPNWVGGSYRNRIFFKVLNAGDITAGSCNVSHSDGSSWPVLWAVYANASALGLRTTTESLTAATTLSLTGFTLAGASAGVLAFVLDRDGASTFSPPGLGGLATRRAPSALGSFFAPAIYDFTVPDDYPEASITFTGFATGNTQLGILLELIP